MPNVKNGGSCYLSSDLWNNMVPMQAYPELFSFAKSKTITLVAGKDCPDLLSLFHLPLSNQAYAQLAQLSSDIQILTLTEEPDVWTCIWQSGSYSVSKAYRHLSGHAVVHPAFKRIWKSSCQSKHKAFSWLMLKDGLSTRELLRRRNMELQDYNCVLCNGLIEESLCHLFIHCPFATSCWNWLQVQTYQQMDFLRNIELFKRQLQVPFFTEIIIIMCWTIWKTKNGLIFNQIQPSIQASKREFKDEFTLLLLRAKKKFFPQ